MVFFMTMALVTVAVTIAAVCASCSEKMGK
jgi:hypothetical protein